MNESFAIQGYSVANQMFCVIDGENIYQTDYSGARRLIGKTSAAYTELEQTTTEYYNKLVELGVIVPPKDPQEMMNEMQQTMLSMTNIIKNLSDQVEELKKHGTGCKCNPGSGEPDVSQRESVGRDAAGAERDTGNA